MAQAEREKQRKSHHHAAGGETQRGPLTATRPGSAGEHQVHKRQHTGDRGAAEGHENRRELRCIGGAGGQLGRRQGHGEQHDTEQAQPQTASFVFHTVSIHKAVTSNTKAIARLNHKRRRRCDRIRRKDEPSKA